MVLATLSEQAGCRRNYSRLCEGLQRGLVQVGNRDAGCQLQGVRETHVISAARHVLCVTLLRATKRNSTEGGLS